MLTVDQAGVFRRGNRLQLRPLRGADKDRALEIAGFYVDVVRDALGQRRFEIEEALSAFEVSPQERRLADGLRKILLDACEFEQGAQVDPVELRRAVFLEAAALRKSRKKQDRAAVLDKVGRDCGLSAEQVDELLFSDLRDAHRLVLPPSFSAAALVLRYETARAQAVLLRATQVELRIECTRPAVVRSLFGRLKFLRLLHRIHEEADGYRVVIDGPLSLFGSVTKYGLSMAMLLPSLRDCGNFRLRAHVLWGKQRMPCVFEIEEKNNVENAAPTPLPEELQRFVSRFSDQIDDYEVQPCHDILNVPGEGICVPDLVFLKRDTGQRVYFEVMGYWSREAVFRKVDLVKKGLPHKTIFAVSSRLRVSQDVLPAELPAALYVYRGAMSPGRVREILDHLCGARAYASSTGEQP